MTLDHYIQKINARFQLGNATEHTFRGDLQQLIETIVPDVSATNEPKRIRCGAPDYVLMRKDIPIGYIEAKDIDDKDLTGSKKTGNKEQFDRYKSSLNNIIFTDYLDFHLFEDGQAKTSVRIAEIANNQIVPLNDNFETFTNIIKNFCGYKGQTIRSSKRLAEMMAGKARMLADVITKALVSDEKHNEDSSLKEQMQGFKDILIHDITPKAFADVYAQTIAYGMFAARLHDPTLPTFSRQEAAELIPKSNPFLRKLFGYIAGPDIDDRILWIVDDLVEIFLACNVEELLKNHGKSTAMQDPIIHFYETFLSEYDPALRKARGVWYTPEPVVNFIVRAVDDILKTEFDLPMGLADTSKTKIKTRIQGHNKEVEQEVHRVQILDPATGTGTFLAEVVQHIYQQFEGQQGIWSNYVENHLIPRLNGFELLMASYAMAHLKLDLLFTETGYRPTKNQRFRIYLTNSLEEHHADTGTLFANWLSTEANEANHIKRDTPVMCVIGNPPYSVSSTNKSEWIEKLTADYKKDLNERNIQPLSDDYIKFIRFGQHFIDKNGSGILAYISNNSFVDGIIHRQMRKHLLESFDKIYILDLHGNAKKKEVAPDGSPDQNVFDIMQGVSINIFVKTGKKKTGELAEVLHQDVQGKRDFKYDFLATNSIGLINWKKLDLDLPNYTFKKIDNDSYSLYSKGFSIDTLFSLNATGVKTERDSFTIQFDENKIKQIIGDLRLLSIEEIRRKYQLEKDGRDWQLAFAKKDVINNQHQVTKILYRPFDNRFTSYSGITKGFMAYPRERIMSHVVKGNLLFVSTRLNRGLSQGYNFISNSILDLHLLDSAADSLQAFPLYIYNEINSQIKIDQSNQRTPNFNKEILNQIVEKMSLKFTNEKEEKVGSFAPIDLLDYIYAVLHSPIYREKYKEFLKIDFPHVPYPTDVEKFWQLVKLGGEIRQLHLLESPTVNKYITKYLVDGNNIVVKPKYENGKVYINESQYFENVPQVAWEFYIGGYQPAQKWLKDRKDRELSFEDILHYQKIIVALTETDRLMKEIDVVGVV
jgi:predicted helicase